jgi:hypothetical protein
MGISGDDGKIVLAVSALAIVVLVVAVLIRRWVVIASLSASAWGVAATIWLGGIIWKIATTMDSFGLEDDSLAALFAMQVTPGAGLYLGLIGGGIVAGATGYVAGARLRREGGVWRLIAVDFGAAIVGLLIVLGGGEVGSIPNRDVAADLSLPFVDTESSRAHPSEPLGETGKLSSAEEPPAADLAAKRKYARKVVLRDIETGRSVLGERGVFGEVKNTGDRTLSEVEIKVYCLDDHGKPVSEDTFHPVCEAFSSLSSRDYMPLRPNYTQPFGFKLESTSDWSGKIRCEVSDLRFAAGDGPTHPVQSDPVKRAYLPQVVLRDVQKGESTLGELGVFGELKNTGSRTLAKVEVVLYCLDASGRRIFEKHYHPLLVLDSSWSIDPDKPLKPNYSKSWGCKMDDAPSDWSGRVEIEIYDLTFAD